MSWFETLLLGLARVQSVGVELARSNILNFQGGLTAAYDAAAQRIDVCFGPLANVIYLEDPTASSIAAALATLDAAGGGILELPAGDFSGTALIDFTGLSNITVRGQGIDVTTLTSDSNAAMAVYSNSTNCHLKRLTLDQDQSSHDDQTADCVAATNCTDCSLENVRIVNACDEGFAGSVNCTRFLLRRVWVEDALGYGILAPIGAILEDCYATGCGTYGIYLTSDCVATGLRVWGNANGLQTGSTNIVTNSRVVSNTGNGVLVGGSACTFLGVDSSSNSTDWTGTYYSSAVVIDEALVKFGGREVGDKIGAVTTLTAGTGITTIASIASGQWISDGALRTNEVRISTGDFGGAPSTQREEIVMFEATRDGSTASSADYALRDEFGAQNGPSTTPSISGTLAVGLTWTVAVSSGELLVRVTPDASTTYKAQARIVLGEEKVVT